MIFSQIMLIVNCNDREKQSIRPFTNGNPRLGEKEKICQYYSSKSLWVYECSYTLYGTKDVKWWHWKIKNWHIVREKYSNFFWWLDLPVSDWLWLLAINRLLRSWLSGGWVIAKPRPVCPPCKWGKVPTGTSTN